MTDYTDEAMIKTLKDPKTVKETTARIFKKLDSDKSGFIDKGEFKKGLEEIAAELGIPNPTEENIQKSFEILDKNGDGKISKKELSALVKYVFDLMIREIQAK